MTNFSLQKEINQVCKISNFDIIYNLNIQLSSQLAGVEAQFQTALDRLAMETHSGTAHISLENINAIYNMYNTVTLNTDSDDIPVNTRVKCNHLSQEIIGSTNTNNDKDLNKRDPSTLKHDSLRMQPSLRR